jgi:hypothetical protein
VSRPIPDVGAAEIQAEQVLAEHGFKGLPVDPIAIAEKCDITVRPAPSAKPGVSGLLLRHGTTFGILYSTAVSSAGFQRFSVAHELGHYFMPGHVDAVLGLTGKVHESRAASGSSDPYEQEADAFAAALLMPRVWFTSAIRKSDDGLDGIEHLAGSCGTSLVATANRYVDQTSIPAAVIVSSNGRVEYCKLSPALREFRGLDWLRRGEPVPTGSITADFHASPALVSSASRSDGNGELKDWFNGPYDLEVSEEVRGLGSWGKVLTVLILDTFADEVEDEAPPRWGKRFR